MSKFKLLKIMGTLAKFLLFMMAICLAVVIGIAIGTKQELTLADSINAISSTFLYIIGYGSPVHLDISLQNILAITGVMALSFLSAYITVKLFWRTDIVISKSMAVWNNDISEHYASLLIKNYGKPVCRIQLTLVAYSQAGELLGKLKREYSFPMIPQRGLHQIDIPITSVGEDTFLFEFLKDIYKEYGQLQGDAKKLYAMWSFVDSATGQESIKMQAYAKKDFVHLPYEKGMRFNSDFLKKPASDYSIKSLFLDWIKGIEHPISIINAIPINSEVISILPELLSVTSRESICLNLNFSVPNGMRLVSPFGMACTKYDQPQNWVFYYEHNCNFEFTVCGSEEVKSIQLEIKKVGGEILIDVEIPITQTPASHSIQLKSSKFAKESYSQVEEVDFTVFVKNMRRPQGHVTIIGCNLVENPTV